MVYGLDFIRRFEAFCPLWLAEEGDPVGLHIGSLDREIKKIMMRKCSLYKNMHHKKK